MVAKFKLKQLQAISKIHSPYVCHSAYFRISLTFFLAYCSLRDSLVRLILLYPMIFDNGYKDVSCDNDVFENHNTPPQRAINSPSLYNQ
jgi:hypothetical protein